MMPTLTGDSDVCVGWWVGDARPVSAARHATVLLHAHVSEARRRYLHITGRGGHGTAISWLVCHRWHRPGGRLHSRRGRHTVVIVSSGRPQQHLVCSSSSSSSDARLRTLCLAEQCCRRLGHNHRRNLDHVSILPFSLHTLSVSQR